MTQFKIPLQIYLIPPSISRNPDKIFPLSLPLPNAPCSIKSDFSYYCSRAAYPSKIIGRRQTVSPRTSNSGDSIWCSRTFLAMTSVDPSTGFLAKTLPCTVRTVHPSPPHIVPRGWNTAAGGYSMALSPMPGRHCALVLWLSPSAPSKEHTIPLVYDGQKYPNHSI